MDLSSSTAAELSDALPASPVAAVVPDDTALMLRYRDGDVRAFELLYERHKGALYRYLQRLCHSPEMANDLFQEVWSKVIASRERYEARAKFTTFLFHIAHNCAIDQFRRVGRPHEKGTLDVDALADELSGPTQESPDAALAESVGLFGLDKLHDVERTVGNLERALDQVVGRANVR